MRAHDYRELIMWQKSHSLSLEIYRLTKHFPASELYGLANQLQRAAVSVPSNIVEGYERGTNKDFRQFLYIARGSVGEVRAQLEIAKDLSYITEQEYESVYELSTEVHKMLNAFIKKIEL